MTKEITIGIFTIIFALFMIVHAESNRMFKEKKVIEVLINKDKAIDQIKDKMGEGVIISFEQELHNKYYFKVIDANTDSTYDVYVNKYVPKVQMIRKSHRARF